MANGLYVGLFRVHESFSPRPEIAFCLGRVKRTTATPSVPWREQLRRSIAIAAEDTRPYRIIVHSREQGYEGLKMLGIFSPDARQRITFVMSKQDYLGKRIVQK